MRQQRMVAAVLAGVIVTSGAGWAAGSRMRSPAQVAADTAPPEASLVTAPVERRTLSSTVTTRGTVRYGEPRTVTLAASSLGAGGQGGSGTRLVTRPPETAAVLGESTVALEVSGRPVFVLSGTVPMYRDLRPGDKGADVAQLEEALARLGFSPGRVDGNYDVATEGAVDAWYTASGYSAQGPTDEQRQSLRTARAGVAAAEDQALQARAQLEAAGRQVTAKEVAMAEADVRADETAAKAALDGARRQAAEDVAGAESALAGAERSLAAARAEIDPQTGRPSAGAAELAALEAAVEDARRMLDDTRRSAEAGVAGAAAAAGQAAEDLLRATRAVPEAERAVEAADDKVALARIGLEALRTPPDTATARAMLAKAERDEAEARRQLRELEGEVGVVVPAGEVLFFPSLPLRVDEPKVARGDDGAKEIMVVSTSRLAVDASVSIPDASLVKVGDRAVVRSTELGIEAGGVVTRLASKPGTDGVGAQKVYMELVPDEPPAELTGASVRISIAVKSTGGEVLAVPVAALSVGSDGTSRVQVARAGGTVRTVAVTPGLSAQGFVEVTPADGARLVEGDRVVVGTGAPGTGDRG